MFSDQKRFVKNHIQFKRVLAKTVQRISWNNSVKIINRRHLGMNGSNGLKASKVRRGCYLEDWKMQSKKKKQHKKIQMELQEGCFKHFSVSN